MGDRCDCVAALLKGGIISALKLGFSSYQREQEAAKRDQLAFVLREDRAAMEKR
jgi:hypothetical protein